MILPLVQFSGGLLLLLVGGRLLVSGSVDAARRLGVSPLVVGLTLVAWGTSAPELALNTSSALKGQSGLALGNVIGANICNMSLVLGACALIRPLVVQERLVRVEIWLNAGVLSFMSLLGIILGFGRVAPGLMLLVFGLYSMWTVMAALRRSENIEPAAPVAEPDATPAPTSPPMPWPLIALCFAGGLALLAVGGSSASDGAAGLALGIGVSAAVVGVTVVSIGTTLPELVTGVLAVRRGQPDLAMGNVLGSCLFNAGAIFGLVGIIEPPEVSVVLAVALGFMGVLSIALIPISRTHRQTVSRLEGVGLLVGYFVFLAATAALVLDSSVDLPESAADRRDGEESLRSPVTPP